MQVNTTWRHRCTCATVNPHDGLNQNHLQLRVCEDLLISGLLFQRWQHCIFFHIWRNVFTSSGETEREKCFYLTTHSTHFIYGLMAWDIWLRTILIVRKETRCYHICYCYRLTARVLLYAPSHRQDNTYQGLCYTSIGPPHEGSIRRPTAPWANALPLSYVPLLYRPVFMDFFLSYLSLQFFLILINYLIN